MRLSSNFNSKFKETVFIVWMKILLLFVFVLFFTIYEIVSTYTPIYFSNALYGRTTATATNVERLCQAYRSVLVERRNWHSVEEINIGTPENCKVLAERNAISKDAERFRQLTFATFSYEVNGSSYKVRSLLNGKGFGEIKENQIVLIAYSVTNKSEFYDPSTIRKTIYEHEWKQKILPTIQTMGFSFIFVSISIFFLFRRKTNGKRLIDNFFS